MPNNIEKMLDHILFLARRFRPSDVKYIVMIILLDLGIEPKYDGYHYLVKAIVLYLEAPTQVTVKNLYIAIAALYNGTVDAQQVEQAIRSAIRQAWNKRSDETWNCYFVSNSRGEIVKPSNGDFISMVACIVELWKGWCQEHKESLYTEEVKIL